MAIKKQEFYEGAALHALACSGKIASIRYEAPFFLLNGRLSVLLKYCTKIRSPWGFTFSGEEQELLKARASSLRTVIALVCGADGVAAFDFESFQDIAAPRSSSIRIACYRGHAEHYDISGPGGTLSRKVAPSAWRRILEGEGERNSFEA
jgi:hypothetical protein